MKFYRWLPILFLLNVWSPLSFAENVNTITVQGKGEATKVPDKLSFQAAVVTKATLGDMAKGISANNQKMKTIFQKLKKLGIKKTDMQTLNFGVNPLYDRKNYKNIYAYEVKNVLSIHVRDMGKMGKVLAAIGSSALISNFLLDVDDPAPLLSTARSRAMKDARKKAKEYAKAGGFQISKEPLKVHENQLYPSLRRTYTKQPMMASASSRSASDVATALGRTGYSANITVEYKILPD